jgi:acetate kinase
MNILVINAGSSSIKYQLIDMHTENPLASGIVERIGLEEGVVKYKTFVNGSKKELKETFEIPDHTVGLKRVAELLTDEKVGVVSDPSEIEAVGHRLVHGGETFTRTVEVTEEVKAKVKELFPLAPLHNPANLIGVEVAEKVFPNARQVGVFDTAFHQSIPEKAYRYAIPEKYYKEMGIRKYGFHGTSHKFISEKAIEYLGNKAAKIITIHLGNGASMAAVKGGQCLDTTMGLGPLCGLIMGTRSGDIDPAIIFYLAKQKGYSVDKISEILNKESGMKGLTDLTDMRDVEKLAAEGDAHTQLALDMYAYRIKQYVGNYAAVMNGVDALVFTAGVGENKTSVRRLVCENMDYLGITWDAEKDAHRSGDVHEINADGAKVKVLIIPTNEELEIAKQTLALIK